MGNGLESVEGYSVQDNEPRVARDATGTAARIEAAVSTGGRTVLTDCDRHVRLACGAVIGKDNRADEYANASACSPLG